MFKNDTRLLFFCTFLSLLILAIDLSIPLGVASGVLYVLVVLLALRASKPQYALAFAGIDSLLTLLGLLYSDSGGIYWMVLANRTLALFVIWVTVLLGLRLARTQTRLVESESRFQVMADQAPVMIWGTDPRGSWNFVSRGWLDFTGRSVAEEQGQGWQLRLHPHDRETVVQHCLQAFQGYQPFQLECRLLRADNQYRWVVLQGVPRCGDDGTFLGFIGTVLDIDDRKAAERKLDEAMQKSFHQEKMASIGTLAAGVLHEISNPVASVSGLTHQLMQDVAELSGDPSGDAEKLQTALKLMDDELNRLIRITRDVNGFTTLQGAELELQDMNCLIERTSKLMSHDDRMLNIELQLQLDRSLPAIALVADHFIQVLFNLLGNAMDACRDRRDGASITLSTRNVGDRVFMEIRDNGCGMAESILARAGEPFFTTKESGASMGLGLSMCRTLVAEQGGELQIDSEQGVGTTVSIAFNCPQVGSDF